MHVRTVYKVHGRALIKVDAVLKSDDFKDKSQKGQLRAVKGS